MFPDQFAFTKATVRVSARIALCVFIFPISEMLNDYSTREWSAVSPFTQNPRAQTTQARGALARWSVALWITQVTLTLLPSFLETGILIVCRFFLHALQTLNNSCVKYESDLTWVF